MRSKRQEKRRQIFDELMSLKESIRYATIYKWVKSGKLDQRVFVYVLHRLEDINPVVDETDSPEPIQQKGDDE